MHLLQKFANYHAPTFPSCHLVPDTPDDQMQLAYDTWGPIFEDTHFEAAFEHHFHLFKKTFPLKNKKIDPTGVIYLGEGKWGATGNRCLQVLGPYNSSGLLETAQDLYHIWIVNITSTSWEYYPINTDGEIFDARTVKQFY